MRVGPVHRVRVRPLLVDGVGERGQGDRVRRPGGRVRAAAVRALLARGARRVRRGVLRPRPGVQRRPGGGQGRLHRQETQDIQLEVRDDDFNYERPFPKQFRLVAACSTARTDRCRSTKCPKQGERLVLQLEFTGWPCGQDTMVPDNPLPLLSFVRKVAEAAAKGGGGGVEEGHSAPVVVHCR